MATADDGDFDFNYEDYSAYYENNVDAGFDMFDRLPGSEFLSAEERAEGFQLFYEAFVENAGGHAREDFYDFWGFDYDAHGNAYDFPWEDWREWMGYE